MDKSLFVQPNPSLPCLQAGCGDKCPQRPPRLVPSQILTMWRARRSQGLTPWGFITLI